MDFEQFLATRSQRLQPVAHNGARPSLRVLNAAADEAELYIYGVIDPFWGISADMVRQELQAISAPRIAVHVNSNGGDVFEAVAIYNLLKNHPAFITTHNDSVALSSASFVMLAGDRVLSAKHSQWMIHDVWCWAVGNAADMRATAEFLDRQTDLVASIYTERGKTADEWLELMHAETWFNAEEAVAAGLADEISGQEAAENQFDLSMFRNAPKSAPPKNTPPPPADRTESRAELAQELLRFERNQSRQLGAA